MPVASFDTHKHVKNLTRAGFTEEQAEAHVAILTDAFQSGIQELATKSGQEQMRLELKSEIEHLRQEVKSELVQSRQEFKSDLAQLRQEFFSQMALMKWIMGAVLTVCVGVFVRLFFRLPT